MTLAGTLAAGGMSWNVSESSNRLAIIERSTNAPATPPTLPRGNRTGPIGMKAMTGRTTGYCTGFGVPGKTRGHPLGCQLQRMIT